MFVMRWHCLLFVDLLATGLMWAVARGQSPAGCGQPSEHISPQNQASPVGRRVVGGRPTTTKSFPWTVLIKRYGHSGVVCTAAILSSRLVLTAAHCFDNVNQYDVYLWVGKDEVDYYNIHQHVYLVEDVVIHDSYNRTSKKNDIALVQTADDIHFNSNVRPVCLPDLQSLRPTSDHCFLAGYGDTQGTGADRRLNFIQVPLVEDGQCGQQDWLGEDFLAVRGVSFCAGYADGGPDTCSGDSGAALVCPRSSDHNYYVYGVASWGKGCGERKKPGVYARVPVYLDWITSHLQAVPRH